MKAIDRFLRAWRTDVALRAAPKQLGSVLDIGCGDGYLLTQLVATRRDGIDPTLASDRDVGGVRLRKGMFPDDVVRAGLTGPYDAIFALAVFEHLTDNDLAAAREALPTLLQPGGRFVLTVPHPFVDKILDVLLALRLIDGQALDEHHGFDPRRLRELASPALRLVERRAFQLGLNNLFVFEMTAQPCN